MIHIHTLTLPNGLTLSPITLATLRHFAHAAPCQAIVFGGVVIDVIGGLTLSTRLARDWRTDVERARE